MHTWTGPIKEAPNAPSYRWTGPAPTVDTRPNHMDKPRDTRPRTVLAGIVAGIASAGAAWGWLIPTARAARGYPVTLGIEHFVALLAGIGAALVVMVWVDKEKDRP